MPPTKPKPAAPGEIVRAIRKPDLSILEDIEKDWMFWAKHNSARGDRAVAAGKARAIRAIIDHIDSLVSGLRGARTLLRVANGNLSGNLSVDGHEPGCDVAFGQAEDRCDCGYSVIGPIDAAEHAARAGGGMR